MPDVLEELALSGVLFQEARPLSRPHSPVSRTPSPNPDDELFGDLSHEAGRATLDTYKPTPEPVGMGPGRTGVKGVIRDRDEARARDRLREREAMQEMRRKMERTAITGKTYFEEEELKRGEEATRREGEESEDDLTSTRPRKGHTIAFPGLMSGKERPTFGYLREVGANGFVQSVEQVDRDVWVVVHLYHPAVARCTELDAVLAKLAKRYTTTKFLRVRADALGFAVVRRESRGIEDEGEGEDSEHDESSVDADILPTMQVYRGGELVLNWVRVDWEAGRAGIADLLKRHHVIPNKYSQGSDDESSDGEI